MTERYELDRDQMWTPNDPQLMADSPYEDYLDNFMDVCYSASEQNDFMKQQKEEIDFVEVSPEVNDALNRIMGS